MFLCFKASLAGKRIMYSCKTFFTFFINGSLTSTSLICSALIPLAPTSSNSHNLLSCCSRKSATESKFGALCDLSVRSVPPTYDPRTGQNYLFCNRPAEATSPFWAPSVVFVLTGTVVIAETSGLLREGQLGVRKPFSPFPSPQNEKLSELHLLFLVREHITCLMCPTHWFWQFPGSR